MMACRVLVGNTKKEKDTTIRNRNLRQIRKLKKKWDRFQIYGQKPMNDQEADKYFNREYRLKLEAEELDCNYVHCRICPFYQNPDLCRW